MLGPPDQFLKEVGSGGTMDKAVGYELPGVILVMREHEHELPVLV